MDMFISAGVAGHVDHGKTTLVRCLTGIDTDRLQEEKQRGLSIEPSVAPLLLPSGGRIALVDVPGHSDFLKNTIRGLSSVDLAILVVAANDGVMPQTRDHLEVLKFLRARGGLSVLSKADLVDRETLELAEMELQEILQGSFLDGKPVVPFSAADSSALDQVMSTMRREAESVAVKPSGAPFRLWIDQVRSFPGFGTVVSGTVSSGNIRRDDIVELLPSGKEVRVRFVEIHHQRVEEAKAGQRVGLNLQGVSLQEISLGNVLAAPRVLRTTRLLNAELSLLPRARRPLLNRRRVKLYVGTYCATALLVIMEREQLLPCEAGLVQLRLQHPVAVLPRDPFVITPVDQYSVIGGGTVLETPEEKFRAVKAEKALSYLLPLQRGDAKSIISLYFAKYPSRPVTVEEIAFSTGLPVEKVQASMDSRMRRGKLLRVDGGGYFDRIRYEFMKGQVVDIATRIFSGDVFKLAASSEEIRFQLDENLEDSLFQRMLQELCSEGRLTRTGARYRIPNFLARYSSQQQRLLNKVVEFARSQGYATFSPGTFKKLHGENYAYRDVEKVINHLHAQKELVRLNDKRFLLTEAMEEIKEKVTEFIQRKGNLAIQDCKELLGFGRTRALPILDYLDGIGLTRRVEDVRVLASENVTTSNQGMR